MTVDLRALREKAQAVRGETWRVHDPGTGPREVLTAKETLVVAYPSLLTKRSASRLAFIAAADPRTVLALIEAAQLLDELLTYTGKVEQNLGPWVATRPSIASFPDGAEELGDRVRAALAVFTDEATT